MNGNEVMDMAKDPGDDCDQTRDDHPDVWLNPSTLSTRTRMFLILLRLPTRLPWLLRSSEYCSKAGLALFTRTGWHPEVLSPDHLGLVTEEQRAEV
jgi:hypothetical protein